MKRKKLSLIVVTLMVALFVTTVKAETVEVNDETTLKTCVNAGGNTCKLVNDIEVNQYIIVTGGKSSIVDLNNYSIGFAEGYSFYVQGGSLEVIGTGEIKENTFYFGPITIKGNLEDSTSKTKVVIGEGVTLNGWAGLFIDSSGTADAPRNSHIEVVMNGKAYGNNDGAYDGYGIYINGTIKSKTNKVTLGETAVVDGNGGLGIYAAGFAEWNITGATIKGDAAGIGIKSGIFNIKDANISSSGIDETPTQGHSNGIYSSGAAIQIESNNAYAGDVEINIDGGTYTSKNGIVLYEYLEADKTTETKVKSIDIKNANFVAGESKRTILVSREFDNSISKFIESGTFSSDVTDYIEDTSIIRKVADNSYVVGVAYNVNIANITNGSVTVDKDRGIANDEIKLTINPNDGYTLTELIVKDANDNIITVTDNTFKLPSSDVTVSASFAKIKVPTVNTSEISKTEVIGVKNTSEALKVILDTLSESDATELKSGTVISLDVNKIEKTEDNINKVTKALNDKKLNDAVIGNFYDITINIKKNDQIVGTLPELKEAIELTVLLPEDLKSVPSGYTRTYYIVRNHNGVMEVLDTKLSDDNKSLTFKSDKFSTYAIAYVDTQINEPSIVENPQTSDDIMTSIFMLIISASVLGSASIVYYKNKHN